MARSSSFVDKLPNSVSESKAGHLSRRQLLTGEERRCLFDPPSEETAIIANYTLSPEDLELIGNRYGAANRLGLASHIALMRHPGFGLNTGAEVTTPISLRDTWGCGHFGAQTFPWL